MTPTEELDEIDALLDRLGIPPGTALERVRLALGQADDPLVVKLSLVNPLTGEPLPELLPIEGVELGGVLALMGATLWCRKDSPACTTSPVWWDPTTVYPWVVEVHAWVDDETKPGQRAGIAFTWPCATDPRDLDDPRAIAAIHYAVQRAVSHEAAEHTVIEGERCDPHQLGEPFTRLVSMAASSVGVDTSEGAPAQFVVRGNWGHGPPVICDTPDAVHRAIGKLAFGEGYVVTSPAGLDTSEFIPL